MYTSLTEASTNHVLVKCWKFPISHAAGSPQDAQSKKHHEEVPEEASWYRASLSLSLIQLPLGNVGTINRNQFNHFWLKKYVKLSEGHVIQFILTLFQSPARNEEVFVNKMKDAWLFNV